MTCVFDDNYFYQTIKLTNRRFRGWIIFKAAFINYGLSQNYLIDGDNVLRKPRK